VAKPVVSKWALKERVREGCIPPAGGTGAVPPEKVSNCRCMQVVFRAFLRQN
jgi:hypothetical protein